MATINQKLSNFKGVIDTTLRDGQQSPLLFDTYTYSFTLENKMAILKGLLELGVQNIEFFSPAVSTREKKDFLSLKKYVRSQNQKVRLLAHCRCHPADIEAALDAGFDGLNLYIGVATHSQKYSHGMKMSEIIGKVQSTLHDLKKENPDIYLRFSVEDFFRTDVKDVYRVYDKVAKYVNTFGMPDTIGIATPSLVKKTVLALKKRYPKVDIECHFHNDRGYALVNSVTAVLNGASYIDTSVWGMAERSGITSITGLLFNLYQEDQKLCTGFNLELCYPLNVLMGSILKYHVPYNEPVSVTNRTHTAGVHQKAVLNKSVVYEAIDLRKFGVTKNQLLLGPLSGWNLIHYYIREFMHFEITKQQAKEITAKFKSQAGRINRLQNPESVLKEILKNYVLPKITGKKHEVEGVVEVFN